MRSRVQQFVLSRFWYVHKPIILLIGGDKNIILAALLEASKPSKDRLHLQELFTSGRRYHIIPRQAGFMIQTTSKSYWRYVEGVIATRRRTRSTAQLIGVISPVNDDYSRIEIRTHIRMGYMLDVVLLPLFMTSILVFMTWTWWIIVLLILLLFGLSFVYHYYNVAFQANEMTFFVEKALKAYIVHNLPALDANAKDMLRYNADFETEWERFYKNHQQSDDV